MYIKMALIFYHTPVKILIIEKERNGTKYYSPDIMKIDTSTTKGLRRSKKGNGV